MEARRARLACRAYATSMTSVTLLDSLEWIVVSRVAVTPNSSEDDQWDVEKFGVLHFGRINIRNGASYALDQYKHSQEFVCSEPNGTVCYRECPKSRSKPVEFGRQCRVQRIACRAIAASAELLVL